MQSFYSKDDLQQTYQRAGTRQFTASRKGTNEAESMLLAPASVFRDRTLSRVSQMKRDTAALAGMDKVVVARRLDDLDGAGHVVGPKKNCG